MKEIKLKGIDETIYYDETDNKMPIYMCVNEKVKNFYITLNVKYGSIDTEFKTKNTKGFIKVPNGIAHFLEHMMFKMPNNFDLNKFFAQKGASINAFTSFNITAYEVYGSKCFDECLSCLIDYVCTPYFTKEDIKNEKEIITEEIRMGEDSNSKKLVFGSYKALLRKAKHRNLISGTIQDIKEINEDNLNLVYNTFYHPQNMFIVITGNFNPYEAAAIIKENLRQKEFDEYANPIKKEEKEPTKVNKEYVIEQGNVEIPKVKIGLKIPRKAFKEKNEVKLNIAIGLILRADFGPTSDLKEELMEKELIASISYSRDLIATQEVIYINIETKYPDEIIDIIKEKLQNLEIDEDNLRRRKKANISALVLSYDDIEFINNDIQDDIITYKKLTDNLYDIYKNLTIEEVEEVRNAIDTSNLSIYILKPYDKNN